MLKILHICLSGQYIDGWGYQENLLPHYLNNEGTENVVIASSNHFPDYMSASKVKEIISKGVDYEHEGVRIMRIPTVNPTHSLVFAPTLYRAICKVTPDIIFHHDVVFTTLATVRHYASKYRIPVFVDNHADELNFSTNRLWNALYHSFANRIACRRILPYVNRFYGVTPGRCEFLDKYYSVPKDKISLLSIGADIEKAESIPPKSVLRKKYGFADDDRIVVSGGKMGVDKGTDALIAAVNTLPCKLILFGSFSDDATRHMAEDSAVTTVFGWCDRTKTLELLRLADVACWPVHHTTLIEDAVSVETPILVRQTGNTSHLVNGNGMWTGIDTLHSDLETFFSMDSVRLSEAAKEKKNEISYSTIARRIIADSLI